MSKNCVFPGRQIDWDTLLFDESPKIMKIACPKVKICTEALIDTGCQISCISQKFYRKINSCQNPVPEIPVTGVTTIGAMGNTKHNSKEILVDFVIKSYETREWHNLGHWLAYGGERKLVHGWVNFKYGNFRQNY